MITGEVIADLLPRCKLGDCAGATIFHPRPILPDIRTANANGPLPLQDADFSAPFQSGHWRSSLSDIVRGGLIGGINRVPCGERPLSGRWSLTAGFAVLALRWKKVLHGAVGATICGTAGKSGLGRAATGKMRTMADLKEQDNSGFSHVQRAARLSVAPMMEWTDRHCRYLHRLLSHQVLLYTEMVTAPALVRGGALHLLDYSPEEHPVALQLGGSDPVELGQAAQLGARAGYDEINLNCGCPSDRVQSGAFGAVLMQSPDLVAECVAEMRAKVAVEVTVKCRIGVDEQEPRDILPVFLEKIRAAGCQRVTIHARKAWLKGLSPKENRDIPPLDYDLVHEMKRAFGDMHISLNGGIASLDAALEHLDRGLDGVMVGRAAYHQPSDILAAADARVYGVGAARDPFDVVQQMLPYIEEQMAQGARLHQISRHMLGLFAGRPGARAWRRVLSEGASRPGSGPDLVLQAMQQVQNPPIAI